MRLSIRGVRLRDLLGAWPERCCGCGCTPTTTYHARIRTNVVDMGFMSPLLGVAWDVDDWRSHALEVPACRDCAVRARLVTGVWVALCVLVGGLCLANVGLAGAFEPDGASRTELRQNLGRAALLGFLGAAFGGPAVAVWLRRRCAPAVIHALEGESLEKAWSLDVTFRDPGFAREVQRRAR